jgi:hypothetical protein
MKFLKLLLLNAFLSTFFILNCSDINQLSTSTTNNSQTIDLKQKQEKEAKEKNDLVFPLTCLKNFSDTQALACNDLIDLKNSKEFTDFILLDKDGNLLEEITNAISITINSENEIQIEGINFEDCTVNIIKTPIQYNKNKRTLSFSYDDFNEEKLLKEFNDEGYKTRATINLKKEALLKLIKDKKLTFPQIELLYFLEKLISNQGEDIAMIDIKIDNWSYNKIVINEVAHYLYYKKIKSLFDSLEQNNNDFKTLPVFIKTCLKNSILNEYEQVEKRLKELSE